MMEPTYPGARATPDLVGRENIFSQIVEAIKDGEHDHIVYITGAGGIGKTRLIQHVFQHPPTDGSLRMASEILDLYHTGVHTIEGFTLALQRLLSPDGEGFERFQEEYQKLINFLITEPPPGTDVHQQRLSVARAFVEDFNRLSEEQRVVLALDTAERLFPLADLSAAPLGLAEEYPDILEWLLGVFLPQIRNVVVLMAGRPGPGNLEERLAQIEGKRLVSIPLVGLNSDEANRYFDAVAEAARDAQDYVTAERIGGLDAGHRQVIYRALCDYDERGQELGVRPILLSLVIDHLSVSGRPSLALQQLFQQSPETLDFTQARHQIEADLLREFMNIPRPANDAICALAWLRKGADVGLLARVADLRKADNTWDEECAGIWMESVRDLSFVKIRPGDQRVFLHDEMYDLLQRHVLDAPGYSGPLKQQVFEAIRGYYKEHIETSRQRIADLYTPEAERKFPDVDTFVRQRVLLLDALVEDLHYALRADLKEGFDRYLLYAEEAIAANDESLDMQLRAELLGTLAQERAYAVGEQKRASDETVRKRWDKRVQEIERLHREAIVPDAAVRWVKRLTQRDQYQEALDIVERLRKDAADLVKPGGMVVQADLGSWEGVIRAYQGDYANAERAIGEALQRLQEKVSWPSNTWQQIVLGRAYNNLGYMARGRGQVLRAAKVYTNGLPYWRALRLAIEQANTLNNLAYTLALQGKFGEARRQGRDALGLREQLGPQPPVALSLSTLAEIEILAGFYREAEAYARRALALAESIEFERGRGLAQLALAALHRFRADPEETEDPKERQSLLDAALQYSKKALQVFEKMGEWERCFRALYERAIALREQCRLAGEGGYPEWTEARKEEKAAESEKAFQEAAEEARQRERWDLYLDALMGQAWLLYYQKKEDLEKRLNVLFEEVKKLLPDYLIEPTRWPGVGESTVLGVFAQLGRYYILRGILALDHAEAAREEERKASHLREAGGQFALAFEYDRHIAEDFRDLQRGIMVVYDRLRKLNVRELTTIFVGMKQGWGQQIPMRGGPGGIKRVEDLLFWRVLEEHFGSYETLRQLVG